MHRVPQRVIRFRIVLQLESIYQTLICIKPRNTAIYFVLMGMLIPERETNTEKTNPMEHARTLMARKDEIESEITTQAEILKANNTDLSSPLVDSEGFPRDDLDVWAVRHARVRVLELRNDLKEIMGEIALALQSVYPPSSSKEPETPDTATNPPVQLSPFAKVDGVHPGSPAATAVCMRVVLFEYVSDIISCRGC